MKTIRLEGTIASGKGEGAKFMKLPWVKKQVKEKLGFVPFPGTLDVKVKDSAKLQTFMAETQGVRISSAPGFCNGKFFKASLKMEHNCAVVIPQVAGYPENMIELVAAENLRRRFTLSDGDAVEVIITV